jgi:pyruvate dehydrogenase E2 component (dihydrolipoamide acetyltransferase)
LAIIGNEGEDISGLTGGAAAPAAGSEEKKEEPKTETPATANFSRSSCRSRSDYHAKTF